MNPKKVENIRHELLVSGIFHTSDLLRIVEVLGGRVTPSLPAVVYHVFDNLTQSPSFTLEIYDNADAATLGTLDGLLYTEDEVRSTGADIRPENVGTRARIVWSTGDLGIRVGELGGVSHDVDRHTSDGREEDLDIRSSQQFGIHPACILE